MKIFNIIQTSERFMTNVASYKDRDGADFHMAMKSVILIKEGYRLESYCHDLVEGDPNKDVGTYIRKYLAARRDTEHSFEVEFVKEGRRGEETLKLTFQISELS